LNIIGKNADLVLCARIPNYKESILSEMLYKDRTLIDGWDKMMSIYLTEEYPNFNHIRKARERQINHALTHKKQDHTLEHKDLVLNYIKENGPTYPKDMNLGNINKGSWGHSKVSTAVFDYLWNIGSIGIYEKNNVIKKYDLIENLLDKTLIESDVLSNLDDFLDWYILRKVGHVGIYWGKLGPAWLSYYINKDETRKKVLDRLILDGRLTDRKSVV